jgi:multidrug efflux pump subunit AcrA (membrane-fusion protein)
VNGPSVEIAEGLAAGDEVVTRGAFALRAGDRVRVARTGNGV